MSANHIVVGAGAVGTATARLLADSGEYVTIISRSGSGPEHPRIDRVGLDAGDVAALVALATGDTGTAAIYNCVNPQYHRWTRDWPPIAAALLAAAEASGAVLVMTGNLYPYGPVDGTITASLPDAATGTKGRVRAQMWADAKAAHDAGRVRAVEVRGSDYLGNGPSLISTGWCRASWRARVCAWWAPPTNRIPGPTFPMSPARSSPSRPTSEPGDAAGSFRRTPRARSGTPCTTCAGLRVSHPSRSGWSRTLPCGPWVWCHRRYASSRRRATSSSSPSSSTRRIPRRPSGSLRPGGMRRARRRCGGIASRAPRRCRGRSG